LGKLLETQQATVAKVEHPDYRSKMTTLERVARALGCAVVDLM
jgi:hypothetical protein